MSLIDTVSAATPDKKDMLCSEMSRLCTSMTCSQLSCSASLQLASLYGDSEFSWCAAFYSICSQSAESDVSLACTFDDVVAESTAESPTGHSSCQDEPSVKNDCCVNK